MGASPNRGHSFGELDEGLFAAAGYTGAGIAMGTTAGILLADLALGEGSERLEAMLGLPDPTRLPPQPFLGDRRPLAGGADERLGGRDAVGSRQYLNVSPGAAFE